ncbi:MAG: HAD-IIB family hydrolase, partial [Lachnospiraceae bacterium]|nr:HAD-IIB family hydrolase [Lachnospiraceae bacterium]
GRALLALPEDVRRIEGIRYAVTSNGAAVYDLQENRLLKQQKLSKRVVLEIIDRMDQEEIVYEAFIDGKPYGQREYVEDPVRFGSTLKAVPYIQSTRTSVDDMRAFLLEHIDQLDCIDVVTISEEKQKELWRRLEREVEGIYITSSVHRLLEISDQDCGKHSGLRYLTEHLTIQREELAAFGDADNDIQMLQFAGTGIAMGNASDACKEAADYVTLTNDEDGVAYAIEKILANSFSS